MADSTEVPDEVAEVLSNVKRYYRQNPNRRILWVRAEMRLYCASNPQSDSRFARFLRNNGEPPVAFDPAAARVTAAQIATLFKTKGCFGTTVSYDTTAWKRDQVKVRYHVTASQRRQIDELTYYCRQPDINDLLQKNKDDSFLKVGDYYDQQKLSDEQTRLATLLKNQGYYYASTDMVRFIVDTTYDSRMLSIMTMVRLPQYYSGDTLLTSAPLQKYKIDNIYVYPNYTTSIGFDWRHFDTLDYEYESRFGKTVFHFVYDKKISPSPDVICRSMLLYHGQTYRPRVATLTSNNLLGLHNFKYIDISFDESPNSTDTNRMLDARVRLLNNARRRMSLSFELTNASSTSQQGSNFFSSGNLGLGATIGYQDNNLFGGAEMLDIEGNLLFDAPKNVFTFKDYDFHSIFSNFEGGVTTSLDLPNFFLPFFNHFQWQRSRPHTLVALNANYLFRKLAMPDITTQEVSDVNLERIRFGGSFGYTWNHLRTTQHKLLPFNLSYSHLLSGDEYYSYLYYITNDPKFLYQGLDYVLLNTHYEYSYSNQSIGTRDNFHYLKFSVETAGNLLNGLNQLVRQDDASLEENDLLYYQYFRFEGEYKRYIYMGEKSTLVLRALVGLGLPYGHSSFLPYEKMFIGGGPTTLRGWGLRQLGYGQEITDESTYFNGIGETQLVVNVEQRFPLIGVFEGALFADFGNVWSYGVWGFGNGNQFNKAESLGRIAFDAGFGLRANISVITLRVDMAVPFYDPNYVAQDRRWVTNNWSWDKLVFNFGINYPF